MRRTGPFGLGDSEDSENCFGGARAFDPSFAGERGACLMSSPAPRLRPPASARRGIRARRTSHRIVARILRKEQRRAADRGISSLLRGQFRLSRCIDHLCTVGSGVCIFQRTEKRTWAYVISIGNGFLCEIGACDGFVIYLTETDDEIRNDGEVQ